MDALKEIVDRYETALNQTNFALDADRSLISRARAELERGVDVRRLLHDYRTAPMPTTSFVEDGLVGRMAEALRAQGVRVVEDGKESSDV